MRAEQLMDIALEEAAKGLGRTSPNPVVGAVVVKDGKVLAKGYHRKAGTAHAEVVALEAAKGQARGAELYTTLEPCNHQGRTPPCSQAILDAGIKRVFFASSDPNPLVNGKGVARLRRAGVEVIGGIRQNEADRLNQPFFKLQKQGLPYVTLKAAVTLDGMLATSTGDSRWVTGETARERVHRLRNQVDAILVGAETVRQDDPQLTTRIPNGKNAVPVVVDSQLKLPSKRKLWRPGTVVATTKAAPAERRKALEKQGVQLWILPAAREGVSLKALLRKLAEAGLSHLLVEGGAQLHGSFLKQKLADELWLFMAPKITGNSGLTWSGRLGISEMSRALKVAALTCERVGEDVLLRGTLAG